MALSVPKKFLDEIRLQAEHDYPNETCGILVGPKDQKEIITGIRPCRNVQDEYHALDSVGFPRKANAAYFIDSQNLVQIQRENRQKGSEIRVIYHSHVDAGAYFSEEDQRIALSEGRPAYPGVAYLVVSVREGKAGEAALFYWDEARKTFIQDKDR